MRRLQKIMSLLLTVAVVITTIPLQVFAEEVKKLSVETSAVTSVEINTEEEQFDDRVYELFEESKSREIPTVNYDELNGDDESNETEEQEFGELIAVNNDENDEVLNTWRYVFRNKTYYSEISEDELIILGDADWLSLETLEKLEEYEMTLRESADYSFLVCVSDYTLDELLELFPTKESITQAYSCYELIGQYLKAESITKEDASEVYLLVESHMTLQEIEDILINEYNAVLTEESHDTENEEPEITYRSLAAVEERFTSQIPDLSNYDKAPYSYDFTSQEDVNTKTGALTYLNNDVNLPGRNGFDLQINRVYNSDNAFEGIMNYEKSSYYLNDVWVNVKVRFEGESKATSYKYFGNKLYSGDMLFISSLVSERQTELKREFLDRYYPGRLVGYPDFHESKEIVISASYVSSGSNKSEYKATFLQSRPIKENPIQRKNYGLGYGWNFSFPSIEVETVINYDERGSIIDEYNQRLFTGDGGSFKFNKKAGFYEYKVKDIDWEDFDKSKTLQVNNGGGDVIYDRIVKHKNGDIWYFKVTKRVSGQGKEPLEFQLTAMQNKFGDTISFYYSENHDMRVTGHFINVIDSVGRQVRIERISGNMIKMLLPDGATITYDTDGKTLSSVTDQANRKTQYETSRALAYYWFTYENYGDDGNYNPQYLLKSIIHPTGLKTEYTFNYQFYDLGYGTRYYKSLISRRNDAINNEASVPSVVNDTVYSYSLTKNKKKVVYYISEAQVNRYGVIDIYSYNENSLLTTQQKKYNNELKYKATYTYDEYDLVSKRVETMPLARTDEWTRDNKGNTLTAIVASNDAALKNTTVMTYDSEYSNPLTKTWQMNSYTKIQEEYTLSTDKKVIQWKKVYELTGSNFSTRTLKEATQYFYDSGYHLIEKRDYLLNNGVISTSYRSNNFSYQNNNPELTASFDGAYLTRQWITGVKNYDGTLLIGDGIIENTFKYDKNGRLIEKKDPNGNITYMYYDAVGRILKEVNPDGTELRKEYNDSNNWLITTDQSGFKMKYQYNSLGQISEVYDLVINNWISRNYYNSKGLLQEQQSNLGKSIRKQNILYDWKDRPISDIYSSNNKILYTETYEYNDSVENKYSQTKKTVEGGSNTNNIVTTSYTDVLGRLYKEGDGNTGTQYFNIYEYDLTGNKIKSTDAKGNSYQYTYDYAGRILTDKNPDGKMKTNTYDALGNLKSSTDYAGSATTYEYDMAGRLLIQSNPFEGTYKSNTIKLYDKNGNIISEKSQNNKMGASESYSVVNYKYNNMNQVKDIINVNPDNVNGWTKYDYDKRGNQIAIHTGLLNERYAGAQSVSYEYDYRNRITKLRDDSGWSELYEYDISGNLIKKTDREENTINYTYDNLNRLIEEKSDYQFSSALSSNNNFNSIYIKTYEYELNGLLKAEDNGQHRITYTYDNRGNNILVVEDFADAISGYNVTRSQAYTYDEVGNRIGFKGWECEVVKGAQSNNLLINQKYSYDKMNRLNLVQADLKTSDLSRPQDYIDVVKYEYDSNSNVKNVYYPRKHTSSPLQKYEYNAANLVKSVTNYNTKGANLTPYSISTFKYTYQLDGNQIEKNSDRHDSVQYEYDALGRLVTEKTNTGESSRYDYDQFGNRTSVHFYKDNILYHGICYEYGYNNRLIASEYYQYKGLSGAYSDKKLKYEYDRNGNQVSEYLFLGNNKPIIKEYIYDYNNRLIQTDNCRYTYRADGYLLNRIEKTTSGDIKRDRFYWDQGYMYAQDGVKASENGLVRNGKLQKFVRGVGLQTVLRSDNSKHDGTDVYYYYNGHGDVVDTIDSSANPLKGNFEYDAFGNLKNTSVIDEYNPIRYAGEYYDAASGLIYLRNRFYNPETGRFINEDPIRDGLNWYVYCGNNPVKHVDPSGLRFDEGSPNEAFLRARGSRNSNVNVYSFAYSDSGSHMGYLSQVQMEANAKYIYDYLFERDWSKNAICGLLGNMEAESGLNPGQWQVWHGTGYGNGYGLVQWTPNKDAPKKYLEYFNLTPEQADLMVPIIAMNSQLVYLLYELNPNGGLGEWGDFGNKSPFSMSNFSEFTQSTLSAGDLAMVWQAYYERPSTFDNKRSEIAEAWFTFFK